MEMTIQSTSKTVFLNGVPARVWEGKTVSGVAVIAFITRVAVLIADDNSQFERELEACVAPSPRARTFPPRMLL